MYLKWVIVRTRFGSMISDKNKANGSAFAQVCLDTNDTFNNVIWTDESSVHLTRHSQTMRVKIGKEQVLKPTAKHTVKVHVWARIPKRGATYTVHDTENLTFSADDRVENPHISARTLTPFSHATRDPDTNPVSNPD